MIPEVFAPSLVNNVFFLDQRAEVGTATSRDEQTTSCNTSQNATLRSDATATNAAERNLDSNIQDSIELQKAGARVVMPSSCVSVVSGAAPSRTETAQPAEAEQNWSHLDAAVLQDWIDLEELGGNAPWPIGLHLHAARLLLQARRQ